MTPLDRYLRRSKAARAVRGIYRDVWECRQGTLSAAYVVYLLAVNRPREGKPRFGKSTVQHAITELLRIPNGNGLSPLVATGERWRRSRVLRAR